jgi:hypothetical protein
VSTDHLRAGVDGFSFDGADGQRIGQIHQSKKYNYDVNISKNQSSIQIEK